MPNIGRRRLVMQHDNRLTVEEAEAVVFLLKTHLGLSPVVDSAFRKVELCLAHAKNRKPQRFGPGATADAPPPLRLSGK